MSRKNRVHDVEESDVDMTPMLDIVFILLIFFIVTTSFVKEEGLMISKPEKNNQPSNPSPTIVVKISDQGLINFNGKMVDIERLPARIENFLAKNETSTAVVIPGDSTQYEHVVKVIDQIKTFSQLTIAIGK